MLRRLAIFFLPVLVISGCIDFGNEGPPPVPRPRGYMRIGFPEKKYVTYDSTCPFRFDIPDYSIVRKSPQAGDHPCWLDWYFPRYKATVYLTYQEVNKNIDTLVGTSWELTQKHIVKAGGLRDSLIKRNGDHVYGDVIDLGGNAASPVQFYLTDSTHHFVRGSLYFFARPNADSLAPVLDFIKPDIYRMAQSLKWK